ncbi:MAG: hypothetical protein AB7F96_14105 [Beijerinckiaceae bacterium]
MSNAAAMSIPERSEVEAALSRILSQPDFQSSSRLCEFLRFIVYEALEGRSAQLKAFTIAVAVYGRDESFDAQSNSIVRVEATRLRRLLERYYSGEGAADPLRIEIPRGGYAPEFVVTRAAEEDAAASELPANAIAAVAPVQPGRRPARIAAAIAMTAAAAGVGFWAASYWQKKHLAGAPSIADTQKPQPLPTLVVEIAPPAPGGQPSAALIGTRLAIEHAFDRYEDIVVLDAAQSQPPVANYRLQILPVQGQDGSTKNLIRIVHSASGEIVWSRPGIPGGQDGAATEAKARKIASSIARPFGVIFSDLQRRGASKAGRQYQCVMASYNFLARPSSARYAAARQCLERAMKERPEFQAGTALLSTITADAWLFGYQYNGKPASLDEAIQMAQRAILFDASSPRAHIAVFKSQFYDKRYQAAFETGKHAMAIDPSAGITATIVGGAYILRGDFDKGIPLIRKAAAGNESLSSVFAFFYFADAYLRGDRAETYRWGMAQGTGYSPLGLMARIIVNHRAGFLDRSRHWADTLKERFPAIYADIPAALERYSMADPLRTKLLHDLQETRLIPLLKTVAEPSSTRAATAAPDNPAAVSTAKR